MDTEIYNIVATVLSILTIVFTIAGLAFAGVQLWQIKINRKRQFDQARREKTVELVIFYSQNINRETKAIEKIVATFTDEQCQDLYNGIQFIIDEKTKNGICKICPNKQRCETLGKGNELCQDNGGMFQINDEALYFIRGNIISYLNTLESVLLAWQLGIVDQSIIEEQFMFLDKKRQRERALEVFRTIAGNGQSYPAIEKFYQYLNKKRNEEAEESIKDILQ